MWSQIATTYKKIKFEVAICDLKKRKERKYEVTICDFKLKKRRYGNTSHSKEDF